MTRKKKQEVDIETLNFREVLEEAVATSTLGRIIASYGAMLTGREKQDANFTYLLLKSGKPLPERGPVTAMISKEKKKKKFGYEKAVKWFTEKYPKEAEALLAKIKEQYDAQETALVYGFQEGKGFNDEYYIEILKNILEIPEYEAGVMYQGVLKPQIQRLSEKKGLVRLVIK